MLNMEGLDSVLGVDPGTLYTDEVDLPDSTPFVERAPPCPVNTGSGGGEGLLRQEVPDIRRFPSPTEFLETSRQSRKRSNKTDNRGPRENPYFTTEETWEPR